MPATRNEFMEKLEAFYAQCDTVLHGPSVDKQPLDLYVMFKAVAEHGGFEAVCLERYGPCYNDYVYTFMHARPKYAKAMITSVQWLYVLVYKATTHSLNAE